MKKVLYGLVIGVLALGAGCAPASDTQPGTGETGVETKTYQNDLYGFEFKYPTTASLSAPVYANFEDKLTQVDLPGGLYLETNFGEAFFVVSAAPGESLENCLAVNLPTDNFKFPTKKTINGVDYYTAEATDAGAGNLYESRLYRTFHNDDCFEFEETIHTTSVGNYPEGEVTELDRTPVWQSLENIMSTVTFKN